MAAKIQNPSDLGEITQDETNKDGGKILHVLFYLVNLPEGIKEYVHVHCFILHDEAKTMNDCNYNNQIKILMPQYRATHQHN